MSLNWKSSVLWEKTPSARGVQVVIVGDFFPNPPGALAAILHGDSPRLLTGVQTVLDRADVRMLQWECAAADSGAPIAKIGPNLRVPAAAAEFLTAGKFDIALLANNHTGDFGEAALRETLHTIRGRHVATVGAGNNAAEANRPLYMPIGNFTLAVLNVCEHEWGTAGANRAGTAGLDWDVLEENLGKARKRADAVLAVLHGGNEFNPFPSPNVRRRLRTIAGMGADAVVNIHPHCPQGIEIADGVPLVYSPGNFYFPADTPHAGSWYCGYLPTVTFDRGGAVRLEIDAYHFDEAGVALLAPGAQQEFRDYLAELSAPLSDQERLRALFDAWADLMGPGFVRECLGRVPPNPADFSDPAQYRRLGHRFICEAHNEVTTAFLRHVEDGRAVDTELIHYIEKLQNRKF